MTKARKSLRGSIAQLAADERGVIAVEFAVVAPIVLLFIVGLVEMGLMFTADTVLRHATDEAARTGRTAYVSAGATQAETIRDRVTRETGVLMDSSRIEISSASYSSFSSLRKPEPFVDANANGARDDGENFTDVNGNGIYDLDQGASGYGATSDVVSYTVTYPWTFFTPFIGKLFSATGIITLKATAVVKNEPF
jgi:Flp pilus assembly protein TadG